MNRIIVTFFNAQLGIWETISFSSASDLREFAISSAKELSEQINKLDEAA